MWLSPHSGSLEGGKEDIGIVHMVSDWREHVANPIVSAWKEVRRVWLTFHSVSLEGGKERVA